VLPFGSVSVRFRFRENERTEYRPVENWRVREVEKCASDDDQIISAPGRIDSDV